MNFQEFKNLVLEEVRHGKVIQFASKAHDMWRKQHIKTNGDVPRVKKNSDGTEGDINVSFHKLHPDWKKKMLLRVKLHWLRLKNTQII